MKILSCSTYQHRKNTFLVHENYQNNSNISKSPSFGNSKAELARGVLKNKDILSIFSDFISKTGKTSPTEAFLELLAIAAGGLGLNELVKNLKQDNADTATMLGDDIFEKSNYDFTKVTPNYTPIVEVLNQNIQFHPIKKDTTIAEVKDAAKSVKLADTPAEPVVSEGTEIPNIEIKEVETDTTYPKKYSFPKKGKLTVGQEALKAVSERLTLEKEVYEKMDIICHVLTDNIEYRTKTGIKLNCNTVANTFASTLKPWDSKDVADTILKMYTALGLEDYESEFQDSVPPAIETEKHEELPETSATATPAVAAPAEENFATVSDGTKAENEVYPKQYVFPKKWGRLTNAQDALKKATEQLVLDKETYEKLDAICHLVINNKEYKIKSGVVLSSNALANTFATNLKPDDSAVNDLISIWYSGMLGLDEQNSKSDTRSTTSPTTNAETQEEPSEETDIPEKKTRNNNKGQRLVHASNSGRTGELSGIGKNPKSSETSKKKEIILSDEYKNTPQNPGLRYIYVTPAHLRDNDIFCTPRCIKKTDSKGNQKPMYLHSTEGALANLISRFKYYTKHPENVTNMEEYFNNKLLQYPSLPLSLRFFTGKPLNDPKQCDLYDLKKELYAPKSKYFKEDDSKTLSERCRENHYKNIAQAIKKYGENEIFARMSNMIIAPQNKKYVQYFTSHAITRFFERYVDFNDIDNLETQFTQKLDMLFNILKRALLENSVQVKTYLPYYSAEIKKGKIHVSYSASITIPSEIFTDEEKKIFGTEAIMLGLGEDINTSDDGITTFQPIIKSIYAESPMELLERITK